MKLKSIFLACLSATTLSGCLTVPVEELQPTADQETIDTAIEHLSDIKGMTITENGVIYYVESLSGSSRWLKSAYFGIELSLLLPRSSLVCRSRYDRENEIPR